VARVGRPSIGHATATGKVLLAFSDAEPGELKAYTRRTITDRSRLDAELARVTRQGYAEAAGEREEDLNAIAAPVFDADGELAGIVGLQGPASRFGRHAMRTAVEPLLSASHAISSGLGWQA
jgi:IclR family acetate operon transcriptional repressor